MYCTWNMNLQSWYLSNTDTNQLQLQTVLVRYLLNYVKTLRLETTNNRTVLFCYKIRKILISSCKFSQFQQGIRQYLYSLVLVLFSHHLAMGLRMYTEQVLTTTPQLFLPPPLTVRVTLICITRFIVPVGDADGVRFWLKQQQTKIAFTHRLFKSKNF